jgi:hypothetical protein
LVGKFGKYWRKQVREAGAQKPLLENALSVLQSLGLIRMDSDSVFPLPIIARYSVVIKEPLEDEII